MLALSGIVASSVVAGGVFVVGSEDREGGSDSVRRGPSVVGWWVGRVDGGRLVGVSVVSSSVVVGGIFVVAGGIFVVAGGIFVVDSEVLRGVAVGRVGLGEVMHLHVL